MIEIESLVDFMVTASADEGFGQFRPAEIVILVVWAEWTAIAFRDV